MPVGPIAVFPMCTEHDGRVAHKSRWFERWHLQIFISLGRSHEAILTLVSNDCWDCNMLLDGFDVVSTPAQCTRWVLMQNGFASIDLLTVEASGKP